MPLEINEIATVIFGFATPEMMLAAAYHGGQRSKGGNVPTQTAAIRRAFAIRLDHHGHCIPPNIGTDALFQHLIARMRGFKTRRYGVDVSRIRGKRNIGTRAASQID